MTELIAKRIDTEVGEKSKIRDYRNKLSLQK